MSEREFNTGYLPLADMLYRIAFYLLESEAEAEDAVQETYLKLWRERGRLDNVRNPKAYCIRTLRNICLDRIRSARRLSFPEQLPELAETHLQDDEFDEKQRLSSVLEAVKALPDRQREILLLRIVDGLSYEEISKKTGINPLTLRVMLSRTRANLKKI